VTDLLEKLDQLVPREDVFGDWDDVLARAGASAEEPRVGRSRMPRRRLLIAVAVALAVAALAAPALALLLGWIDRRDVSFSRSRPAPNVVKKHFYDLGIGAPPRFAIGVRAGRAREVGKYRVRGEVRALWVAPTRDGGFCSTSARARRRHALRLPPWRLPIGVTDPPPPPLIEGGVRGGVAREGA